MFYMSAGPTQERLDLGGWKVSGGVIYDFPDAASLEGGAFWILADNAEVFRSVYGFPPDAEFRGFLPADEAVLTLRTAERIFITRARARHR